MLQLCQASCAFCSPANSQTQPPQPPAAAGGPTAPPCEDELSVCPYLARHRGLCGGVTGGGGATAAWWMATQCRRTCGLCTPPPPAAAAAGAAPAAEPAGRNDDSASPPKLLPLRALPGLVGAGVCRDYHAECPEWAAAGRCGSNPSFMRLNCRASCDKCRPGEPAAEPPPPAPPPPAPGGWLPLPGGGGQLLPAQVQPGFPGVLPGAGVPHPGVGATGQPPPYGSGGTLATSEAWAPFWLCGAQVALAEDPLDCTKMEESNVPLCADANEKECKGWAATGECTRNPEFMVSNCRRSCGYCTVYHMPVPYEFLTLGRPGNLTAERSLRRRAAAADGPDALEQYRQAEAARSEARAAGDPSDLELVGMPMVGLGTAGLGEKTEDAVAAALGASYTLVDTAEARDWYRQDLVGAGIRRSGKARESLFLVSKLHPRDHGTAKARAALKRTLEDLGTYYLDLLLIHYPECFVGNGCRPGDSQGTWQDSWREMERMHREGLVRAIGVSNFNLKELEELTAMAKVKPAVLQARSDPLEVNSHLLRYCLEHGIAFVSYSLFGTQWSTFGGARNPVLTHPTILAIAAELEKTPAQVILRWALQRGMSAIPRSSSPQHIKENIEVFDFDLEPDQMDRVDALDGTYRPPPLFGPPGGGAAAGGGGGGGAGPGVGPPGTGGGPAGGVPGGGPSLRAP